MEFSLLFFSHSEISGNFLWGFLYCSTLIVGYLGTFYQTWEFFYGVFSVVLLSKWDIWKPFTKLRNFFMEFSLLFYSHSGISGNLLPNLGTFLWSFLCCSTLKVGYLETRTCNVSAMYSHQKTKHLE